MNRPFRYLCILAILAAVLLCAACDRTKEGEFPLPEPASAPTGAPTAYVQTPAPTATPEPTPTPTPLLTEYAFGTGASWEQVEALRKENPALNKLDLLESGLDVRERPDLLTGLEELRFSADLCGVKITDETDVFIPLTAPEEWDLETLKLLKGLKTIDLTAAPCEPEQIAMIREWFPEQEILWRLTLCGTEVGPDTKKLNFNDQPIDSLEPFYRTLPLLTGLTSLEMCGCGVGNEEMDALRTSFPHAGIVWSIKTKNWTVRTDADHFATWRVARTDENGLILEAYSINFNTNADLDWLQYCHDLVALDVGHNLLTDCEFVRNMPKLKYLIIADNRISDLSPVATLSELKYFECFANPVTDLSPLSGLTKLLDINMCGCYISDLSPLYGLPLLERVWMTPYNLKDFRGAEAEFHTALPCCTLQYINDRDFTGKGWRLHPRYTEYRLALGRAKP